MYPTIKLVLCLCTCLILGQLAQAQLNCPPIAFRAPKDINDLRPNNINVIMTLGDSISAGFGIMGRSGLLNEYRGRSFSIGGDTNATTVANFIAYFNPPLIGSSLGAHPVEICYGPLCPPFQYRREYDVFDAAQSGAMVTDLVSHELDYLLREMKANPKIDMKGDWKLLNLLIGANDLCASCTYVEKKRLTADAFETHLRSVIEKVRMSIPRTLVNLIQFFNISQIYNLSLTSNVCKTIHRTLFIECDCLFAPNGDKVRQEMDELSQMYNTRLKNISDSYYQKYTDFGVAVQRFGSNTKLSDMPIAVLSDLDCFHPSLMTHEAMAVATWNNLLTPYANKKTQLDLNDKPMCPTNTTLLYTY